MSLTKNFLNSVNSLYAQSDLGATAKNAFKSAVNVGEAVLNVFTNFGIAGFKFQCPLSERVTLENSITTHYLENNEPVQDHIATKPVTIEVRGFQGDYCYELKKTESIITNIVTAVGLIGAMMPQLDDYTQQVKTRLNNVLAQSTAQKVFNGSIYQNAFNGGASAIQNLSLAGVNLFNIFQDLYKLKYSQVRAFLFFEALCNAKLLFTVETSWKRYNNMVIQRVVPVRDNNADITDFTVQLMQINFTSTIITSTKALGRTRQQVAETANKGVSKGQEVELT